MDVKILKAEMNDFEEIIDVLVNSSLGQRYYPILSHDISLGIS